MSAEELFPVSPSMSESDKLLLEWARWWLVSDETPAKMPKSLHIRTAQYFTAKKYGPSQG